MKKIVFLFLCLLIGVSSYAQQKKTVKKKAVKSYTTEQAIAYVEDYFNFYEADWAYDNIEARKVSSNTFYIKVQVCRSKGSCYETEYDYTTNTSQRTNKKKEFWWDTKLYTLVIGSGGKYKMEEKFNY